MNCNLYITPYFEQNEARRKELEICFENNLKSGFDNIYLVVEQKDEKYATELMWRDYPTESEIQMIIVDSRPAFQKYISMANMHSADDLHVVMNSDCYIESSELQKLKMLPWKDKKLYVPLSRWDLHEEGAFLLDRADTSDTFCFYGHCDIKDAYCPLGWPGIENSLAWKFKEKGYQIANVSRSIQTMHLHHMGNGNNYRENGHGPVKANMICQPPYEFHPTCFISDIK